MLTFEQQIVQELQIIQDRQDSEKAKVVLAQFKKDIRNNRFGWDTKVLRSGKKSYEITSETGVFKVRNDFIFDFWIINTKTFDSISINLKDFFEDSQLSIYNEEEYLKYNNAYYYRTLGTKFEKSWECYHNETFQTCWNEFKKKIQELLGLDLDVLYPVE
jgi:hypothetical protein